MERVAAGLVSDASNFAGGSALPTWLDVPLAVDVTESNAGVDGLQVRLPLKTLRQTANSASFEVSGVRTL